MIAYKVKINNRTIVTGGSDDLAVLTAVLTATGKLGSHTLFADSKENPHDPRISFQLGGLTRRAVGVDNEHLTWLEDFDLNIGDKLNIEIVETNSPDPIASSKTAEDEKDIERLMFEHAKKNYFALKDKFE